MAAAGTGFLIALVRGRDLMPLSGVLLRLSASLLADIGVPSNELPLGAPPLCAIDSLAVSIQQNNYMYLLKYADNNK
mgnify:CR=1 FL=1